MAWMDERDGVDAHRLAAEIANEPQWVVFDDPNDEDRWAAEELQELSLVACWWVGVH
jgi:hypothetical protein